MIIDLNRQRSRCMDQRILLRLARRQGRRKYFGIRGCILRAPVSGDCDILWWPMYPASDKWYTCLYDDATADAYSQDIICSLPCYSTCIYLRGCSASILMHMAYKVGRTHFVFLNPSFTEDGAGFTRVAVSG